MMGHKETTTALAAIEENYDEVSSAVKMILVGVGGLISAIQQASR